MTSTVTEASRAAITANPLNNLSTALGLIVIALLMMLLVQKELFRAQGGSRWTHVAQTLDTAILPLLLATGCIVSLRVLDIMNVL